MDMDYKKSTSNFWIMFYFSERNEDYFFLTKTFHTQFRIKLGTLESPEDCGTSRLKIPA